ncbi:MAG TPA: transposase [Solirubrobacteraceae bacterium]
MPRKPREEIAGGIHHVFARGNDRQRIFVDDADRAVYIGLLRTVIARLQWRCLTYCLMRNHVHLLIETPTPNLGVGMQRLQGIYARSFNRRHGRSGHLFQSRYGCVRVEDDAQLWMTVGYIVRNPVAAGLCAEPEEWRWSGHGAIGGRSDQWLDTGRLLAYLAALGGDPHERYAECVAGA